MADRAYEDAVALLEHALTFGVNPSLVAIDELCEQLGRPQDSFESIQVTGTNGKTSTVRMIEALLRAHGVSTGLYTSPHLERYPERIEVAGKRISDPDFARFIDEVARAARVLRGDDAIGSKLGFTEFEVLTAASLCAFRRARVHTAVLEVGMGGRWDATSVASPTVAVITGVGLDHMHVLGDSLEAIAAEKAAIIRSGSAAVLGAGTEGLEPVFLERVDPGAAVVVRESGRPSPAPEASTVRFTVVARPTEPAGATVVDVRGRFAAYPHLAVRAPSYQAANLACAIAAAEASLGGPLEQDRIAAALGALSLPGRFELLRREPPVVVDGAHNPQAAAALASAIVQAWPEPEQRPALLLGVLADKDVRGIIEALWAAVSVFSVSAPRNPRALAPSVLAEEVARVTGRRPREFSTLPEALEELLRDPGPGLVVTGSLSTAGQARGILRGNTGAAGDG